MSRPSTRRPVLGEATGRVNNAQAEISIHPLKSTPIPHHESRCNNGQLYDYTAIPIPAPLRTRSESAAPAVANLRVSEIVKEGQASSKRNSQVSTISTTSDRRIKMCIGPWKLGRTLGHGATARVRLAKHIHTGQKAAVKIVQKKTAQISQAGSLADLERLEATLPEEAGVRRIPVGIEREVAIMKLIQHPNIMKLYDIWENHSEM